MGKAIEAKVPTKYGWLTACILGLVIVLTLVFYRPQALVPLILAFGVTVVLGYLGLPALKWLKTGQVIRRDGPQSHLAKGGTPTMGGLFWVPPALVLPLIWVQTPSIYALSFVTLGCGAIGCLDDWKVITSRPGGPRGISARLKMALLLTVGGLFCGALAFLQHPTILQGWHGEPLLSLGLLFWPLALFVLSGTTNAVNITDGLDGLAAGTGTVACLGMSLVVPSDLAIACWVMAGCCLGFLVFNHKPARVFMGDTGSLALGGFLSGVALLSGELLPLLVMGGGFVVETISVMLQVSYYKATKDAEGKGKRLFRMAPLHHHLELSGWPEVQVVGFFYVLALGLGGLAIALRLH